MLLCSQNMTLNPTKTSDVTIDMNGIDNRLEQT